MNSWCNSLPIEAQFLIVKRWRKAQSKYLYQMCTLRDHTEQDKTRHLIHAVCFHPRVKMYFKCDLNVPDREEKTLSFFLFPLLFPLSLVFLPLSIPCSQLLNGIILFLGSCSSEHPLITEKRERDKPVSEAPKTPRALRASLTIYWFGERQNSQSLNIEAII